MTTGLPIPIKTIYPISNDLISVSEKIEGIAKYVRQSGGNQFAMVKYLIEPFESEYPIIFVNEVEISDHLHANFLCFLNAVKDGIEDTVNFHYTEDNKKIGCIKISILELLTHDNDSRIISHKIAGSLIIRNNFKRDCS